jgi:hypothetical protein
MSYVSYNSQKIIPAPFVRIEKEWIRTEDGAKLSRHLVVTLTGTLVRGKGGLWDQSGYPPDDDTDSCLQDLLDKQEELRELFDVDYQWLEIKPDPEATSTATKWVAKARSIEFERGLWYDRTDYTIVLETQDDPWDGITEAEETWELQYNESPEDTYNLTHIVNCKSREEYVTISSSITEGWIKAQDYVNDTMGGSGIDNSIVKSDPGFNLAVSFAGYNHVVNSFIDEHRGIYRITETWIMSETDTHSEQVVEVRTDRDIPPGAANTTVVVSGFVQGFRQDDGTGYDDALTYFTDTIEPNLYSVANTATPGDTLKTVPRTSSVIYDTTNRKITYTYTYDNGTTEGTNDMSVTINQTETDCDKTTVTVAGTIQGVKDDTNSAYDNALTLWNAFKSTILTEANDAYTLFGGTGTLQGPVNVQVVYDEYNGRISYSYTYHDWPTTYTDDQSVTVAFIKTEDVNRVTVAGTVTAFCHAGYNDALTYFNSELTEAKAWVVANGYVSGLGANADNKNIVYNEFNRVINYSYEFSDLQNNANVDTTTTVKETSDNCGRLTTTLEGTIVGKATGATSAWDNAKNVFNSTYASADPSLVAAYAPGSTKVNTSKSYNEFNNTITFSYDYTDEPNNYVVDETLAYVWDEQDCAYARITQSGTINGLCTGGAGSAYANALSGLGAVSKPTGAGSRVRASESHNEKNGVINYSNEYTERTDPYVVVETETIRASIDKKTETRVFSGTVTGFCTSGAGPNTKYSNALDGYNANKPTAPSGFTEINSSVGHNRHAGVITYSFQYDELDACITDSIESSVVITTESAADVFAVVPILGGNSVIQDKGGSTPLKRSVAVTARLAPEDNCDLDGAPDVSSVIDAAEPSADVVVVERDVESWDPWTGRYSRTKSWVYTDCD